MTEEQKQRAARWFAGAAIAVGLVVAVASFWEGFGPWAQDHWLGLAGLALIAIGLFVLPSWTPGSGRRESLPPVPAGDGGPGPGRDPVGPVGIVLSAFYVVGLAVFVFYLLFAAWPDRTLAGLPAAATASSSPVADSMTGGATGDEGEGQAAGPGEGEPGATGSSEEAAQGTPAPVELIAGYYTLRCSDDRVGRLIVGEEPILDPECEQFFFTGPFVISFEQRLLLIVILAGALGGLIHTLRSLSWYTGNRDLRWSWLPMYLLLPFVGSAVALVFYLAVKGGFFVNGGSPGDANPFGFAAVSGIVGMFSTQAVLKLKQVAETVFAAPVKGADPRPQDANGNGDADGGAREG